MSQAKKLLKPAADFKKLAYFTAKKRKPMASEDELNKETDVVLAEWEVKRDTAANKGTVIHNVIHKYTTTGLLEKDQLPYLPFCNRLLQYFQFYHKSFNEYLLDFDGTAGTADKICQRQKKEDSVYDFFDYKTNETKEGESYIKYDSMKVKEGEIKHYNRFLNEPLSYLEDCNYNDYCVQLSGYAYMAEKKYGIKVGKLAIINILNGFGNDIPTTFEIIPVPYMRYEMEVFWNYLGNLKSLPGQSKILKTEFITDNEW